MTIAILSWGAHQTLINTLESYQEHGLTDYQKVIFFQEISDEDRKIALRYGYDPIGDKENIGIAGGYQELIRYAKGDFFLFLENDWQLLRDPRYHLYACELLLDNHIVDVIRLRDRENPGAPLWSKQYEGQELTRPEYLLESVHWAEPGILFPQLVQMQRIDMEVEGEIQTFHFSLASSKYANWTNNPTLFRTKWLKDTIMPRMDGDVEKALQGWWQEQSFNIAHSDGLFTHNRIDR